MSDFDQIRRTIEKITGFDRSTPISELLDQYRRLEQELRTKRKTMDINSAYWEIFRLASFLLLNDIRNRFFSDESLIEGEGLPPQLKETLDNIRSNKIKQDSILWLEKTSTLWGSKNPVNWENRLECEYDPNGNDYFESWDLFKDEVCDPITWKYRREVIPAALFNKGISEVQVKFISDLRNLFGLGFYLHVVIVARMALEAGLKEKLNTDICRNLGGKDGLIRHYIDQSKNKNKSIEHFMQDIQQEGNKAAHSLVHMKKLKDDENLARSIIIKLIFCLEDIYR